MDKVKKKLIIMSITKTINRLVNNEVWISREGIKIEVSKMKDQYLLFSHRFLSNRIDNLIISNNLGLDDEVFKLSILAIEGLNVFVKEIIKRNLTQIPSECEKRLDFNESLKSKNELSFKKEYLERLICQL